MEGANDPKGGEGTNGAALEGSKGDPSPAPKTDPSTVEKPKPAAKTEGAPKGDAPSTKPEPKQVGEDDEIPEDSELVSMSKQALTKRLDRHTKKELRERFGTDDYAKIKADLDELASFRAKKEEDRKAQLTKEQKLQEERDAEKKRADAAEAQLQKERDSQVFAEYDTTAKDVFSDKVAPKHVKRAMRELKEHILGLDEAETPTDPKKARKAFEKWTKDWLEENPEFAKAAPEEPKKIALNTGTKPARPEKGDAQLAHKTAKPGQANSMSKTEYNEFKRSRGLA